MCKFKIKSLYKTCSYNYVKLATTEICVMTAWKCTGDTHCFNDMYNHIAIYSYMAIAKCDDIYH